MSESVILDQILEGDDITWQSVIMDAVRTNQMDPWDIDISQLAADFLVKLRNLTEMNFKLTGKVVLASALLLKLKSKRFVDEDISLLDQLISSSQQPDDEYLDMDDLDAEYDDSDIAAQITVGDEEYTLQKRTPQPRKRKVSVYDLIGALEQAIESNKRKELRKIPTLNIPQVNVPHKNFDIVSSMDLVHKAVKDYFQINKTQPLSFSSLIPSESRNDKIYTFIPLLHLRNAQMVDLHQEEHFEDFYIEHTGDALKQELE